MLRGHGQDKIEHKTDQYNRKTVMENSSTIITEDISFLSLARYERNRLLLINFYKQMLQCFTIAQTVERKRRMSPIFVTFANTPISVNKRTMTLLYRHQIGDIKKSVTGMVTLPKQLQY